jgi:hypothetical protein
VVPEPSQGDILVAHTDPYFSGPVPSLSRPELGERSRAKALLGAFGSTQVKQRYLAWALAAASLDEEHSLLEWNWREEGGDPNRPIDPTTLKTLLEELQPAEVEAREALASAMACELSGLFELSRAMWFSRLRPADIGEYTPTVSDGAG